ncbi:MAG TPA: hypothetical protein VFV30_09100 [Novosphingobium sp.]|nr:hypothetical protein [Novosphingobium sp.]
MASRRQVILGLGGALVAGAAAGTWRVMRQPDSAIAPWQALSQRVADPRLDALRHAILAPNPHNRQPWLIRLDGSDSAVLTCDLAKRLPETDPFDRQITIGFGTFIELAAIAASQRGYRLEVESFPEGEPQPRLDRRPVARLRWVADPALPRDPLAAAIVVRRTNRQVYAPLPPGRLAALAEPGVTLSDDAELLARVARITVAAITGEMETPAAHMESVNLMRIGAAEIDAMPDGLALSGPMIEATSLVGLTTRAALADPASTAYRLGLEDLQRTYGSIPAALWITTPDNTRTSQIAAGRAYARATLRAARAGVAVHPLSQSLQEYPAMAAHFAQVHSLLAPGGGRVQMLARAGLAAPVRAAARYPLEAHLLT